MTPFLFTLATVLVLSGEPPTPPETPRKPNPLAPSLPQLSDEEENQLDQTINRFIDAESGKLRGADAKKAQSDFQKLGAEAIPALIRGLNRAAKIDHSCPAVIIAKKLARMFSTTKDPELLEFARENIGAGVTQSRHLGIIKDLRVLCTLRKRTLAQEEGRATIRTLPGSRAMDSTRATTGKKDVRDLGLSELIEAAGSERGPRLKAVLTELGRRHGEPVIAAIGAAAATYDGEVQQLARDLLVRQLSGVSTRELKEKLKDDRAEIRAAAARTAGRKGTHLETELIELLSDAEAIVRQQAHQALVTLSKGTNFGPKDGASEAERKEAQQKWRAWLAKSGR
jgi:hypothetical protein